jgi:hypothetical protein
MLCKQLEKPNLHGYILRNSKSTLLVPKIRRSIDFRPSNLKVPISCLKNLKGSDPVLLSINRESNCICEKTDFIRL